MESENPSWFYLFDKAIWEAQNEDQDIYWARIPTGHRRRSPVI